jgi:hypothetical protein
VNPLVPAFAVLTSGVFVALLRRSQRTSGSAEQTASET